MKIIMNKKFISKFLSFILIYLSSFVFIGCANLGLPFLIGATGVGVATKILVDKRSAGAQLDDSTIESNLNNTYNNTIPNTNINVTSFNRAVLLTGQVPNPNLKQQAESIANDHPNSRGVFNYLTVGPNSSISSRSSDSLITTKVKSTYLGSSSIKSRDIKVVTEEGVVYLFGIVTASEADLARNTIAEKVGGVKKIVSLFEIQS